MDEKEIYCAVLQSQGQAIVNSRFLHTKVCTLIVDTSSEVAQRGGEQGSITCGVQFYSLIAGEIGQDSAKTYDF